MSIVYFKIIGSLIRNYMASNTENPLKTSFVFLIRHSLYGLAMFEGFRWFT